MVQKAFYKIIQKFSCLNRAKGGATNYRFVKRKSLKACS